MRDTDDQSEPLLKVLLDDTARGLWCLAAPGLKPVQDGFTDFRGVSVSAIVQGDFSSCAVRLPPAVRR